MVADPLYMLESSLLLVGILEYSLQRLVSTWVCNSFNVLYGFSLKADATTHTTAANGKE